MQLSPANEPNDLEAIASSDFTKWANVHAVKTWIFSKSCRNTTPEVFAIGSSEFAKVNPK